MNHKIKNQINLQEEMRSHGINLVTCGKCGDVMLHKIPTETIECPYCDFESEPCDFPDLFYRGLEESEHWIKQPKENDVLICIDQYKMPDGRDTLTVGKEYTIVKSSDIHIEIIDDEEDSSIFYVKKLNKKDYWGTYFKLKIN